MTLFDNKLTLHNIFADSEDFIVRLLVILIHFAPQEVHGLGSDMAWIETTEGFLDHCHELEA